MKWLAIFFTLFILSIIVLADMGIIPHYLHVVYDFPYGDKAGHFILFGLLSLILNLTFLERPHKDSYRLILTVSLILAILIGLEEWSQKLFAQYRTFDLFDLACNWLGVTFFAWVAWKLNTKRRSPTSAL